VTIEEQEIYNRAWHGSSFKMPELLLSLSDRFQILAFNPKPNRYTDPTGYSDTKINLHEVIIVDFIDSKHLEYHPIFANMTMNNLAKDVPNLICNENAYESLTKIAKGLAEMLEKKELTISDFQFMQNINGDFIVIDVFTCEHHKDTPIFGTVELVGNNKSITGTVRMFCDAKLENQKQSDDITTNTYGTSHTKKRFYNNNRIMKSLKSMNHHLIVTPQTMNNLNNYFIDNTFRNEPNN
jgi:hypothetical protein